MIKIFIMSILFFATLTISACSPTGGLTRHSGGFFYAFDTYIQITIYTETEQEFDEHFYVFKNAFKRYHILFDVYNSYDGINNMHTINLNAGISPIVVDPAIIDLLTYSIQAYHYTGGMLNIALGSVLSIWHDYRMHGLSYPEYAVVPCYYALRKAANYMDINYLIIDEEAGTVFLAKKGMLLDVGATAKAFAMDRVATILVERGVTSAVIDVGGDIIAIGEAMTGGGRPWSIGIRDPETGGLLDAVRVRDMAAATSGNQHRTFTVDGIPFNHIIDPTTLMPAVNFASVGVIHESIAIAEMLSTALFILPLDKGYELAQKFNGAVLWLFEDGTVEFNLLYSKISQNFHE